MVDPNEIDYEPRVALCERKYTFSLLLLLFYFFLIFSNTFSFINLVICTIDSY